MKIINQLVIVISLLLSVQNFAQVVPCPPEYLDDCEDNQTNTGLGRPVPIDDYAGILIIAGVVAAGAMYSKKEKLNFKK